VSTINDLFGVSDTLDAILLGFFFFGLVFVVLTLVLGFADVGLHSGHDAGDFLSHDLGDAGHAGGHASPVGHLNVGTVLAFTMWFGGVTYLLKNALGIPSMISLLLGLGGGLFGGWLIVRFLRFVRSKETVFDARQEVLGGASARVTSSIREGGTGEIVYELHGVRQVSAARALDGGEIARGSDVIVVRRDRGIAYVEPWNSLSDAEAWEQQFQLAAGETTVKREPS
jgi:membrane protein implicated in regulation of membrane protease activity